MKKVEEIEIRSIKRGKWYWIDKSILKNYASDLKSSGLAVYNVLAYFANSKSQSCFPTQKTIADLIGLSRRTVSRKIRLLKEKKLIEVERIRGRLKYFLLFPKESKNHRGCDKKDTSYETQGNTNKNKSVLSVSMHEKTVHDDITSVIPIRRRITDGSSIPCG